MGLRLRHSMVLVAAAALVAWTGSPTSAQVNSESWIRTVAFGSDTQVDAVVSSVQGVVAVGDGIWFSRDAKTWASVLDPAELGGGPVGQQGLVNAVSTFGSGFVAGGQAVDPASGQAVAAIWISPDGQHWTRVHDVALEPPTPPIPAGNSSPTRGSVHAITSGGPGLVAVGGVFAGTFDGNTLVTPASEPAIWTSVDAVHWTRVDSTATFGAGPSQLQLNSVATYHGSILAVATDGESTKIFSSRDATHWRTNAVIPGGFAQMSVHRDLVVAVGSATSTGGRQRAAIWTSPDARRWRLALASRPAGLAKYTAVATSRQSVVAVGYRGNNEPLVDAIASSSTDGRTWKPTTNARTVFARRTYLTAATNFNDLYLAFGVETSTGTGTAIDPFRPQTVLYTTRT